MNIVRKVIDSQPILFIQRQVDATQLQPLFAECFPKLFVHASSSGAGVAGQPLARYVSTDGDLWTVDCAIPVLNESGAEGEIQSGALQAGPVAFVVHIGDYGLLRQTHAVLEQWIEDRGYQSNGPAWESYVDAPDDSNDYKTEVFRPLGK